MKNDREFTGTLLGFDDFVSEFNLSSDISESQCIVDMVLEDVTELWVLCSSCLPNSLNIALVKPRLKVRSSRRSSIKHFSMATTSAL
jgi:hypothetical protein